MVRGLSVLPDAMPTERMPTTERMRDDDWVEACIADNDGGFEEDALQAELQAMLETVESGGGGQEDEFMEACLQELTIQGYQGDTI